MPYTKHKYIYRSVPCVCAAQAHQHPQLGAPGSIPALHSSCATKNKYIRKTKAEASLSPRRVCCDCVAVNFQNRRSHHVTKVYKYKIVLTENLVLRTR